MSNSNHLRLVWLERSDRPFKLGENLDSTIRQLEDNMMRAVHMTVDPAGCILLTLVIKVVRERIKRLSNKYYKTIGFCGGPGYAVNIARKASLEGELSGIFQLVGIEKEELQERLTESRDTWCGIGDDKHTWMAVMVLISEEPIKSAGSR